MKIVNGWHLPEFDTLLSKHARKSEHPFSRFEQKIFDSAISFVEKFDLAIDVGANVGFFSTRLAKIFKQVQSFEPADKNYSCLKENVKFFNNIKIYKFAIGDKEEELDLELPKDNPNCGAFSFKDFKHIKEGKNVERVKVVTLDSLSLDPNLIKIDTQGFEKNVLIGGLETIKRSTPIILAEVGKKGPTKELLDVLSPLGYEIVWSSNSDKIFCKKTTKMKKHSNLRSN